MPALVWENIRRRSPSVQDFADNLRADIQKLPADERAETYRDTLKSISPLLEKRVADETQVWVDRGYAPDRALTAATYGSLLGRRRALAHHAFANVAPELADKFMRALESNESIQDKAEAVGIILERLRPESLLTHPKPNGEARLREAGFDEWFIQWALTRRPLDVDDIKTEIAANMDAGMDGREALRRGVKLALDEFILDSLMAYGVAYGVDFCGAVLSIISAAVGAVVAVVGAGINIARGVRDSRDNRAAAAQAEAQWYLYPLSRDEIEAKVIVFRDRGLNKTAARQALIDHMRTVRTGRERLNAAEMQDFEDVWQRQEALAAALRKAAAEKADLPRKIIAYGAPAIGVLVLGLAFLKK